MRGIHGYGMNYGYGGMEGHFAPWGAILMGLLFVALIVVAIIALVRLSKAAHHGAASVSADLGPALALLAERFAKGEIDAETYRSMKGELEKK